MHFVQVNYCRVKFRGAPHTNKVKFGPSSVEKCESHLTKFLIYCTKKYIIDEGTLKLKLENYHVLLIFLNSGWLFIMLFERLLEIT